MAYIDESLSAGEEIAALFRLHWVTRIPMAFWLLLAIPSFGITLVLAVYEHLRLRHTEQGVTNKRIVFKTGIISRKSEEMKLGSIETVEIDQGILGRILGYGTVKVTGRGTSDVLFRNVADPMAVKRAIESISHPAA
ncbi:MAG: PH domain-containing protein [Burkholderiales bacterium]|nr:PH domain-containing protein [Burkholderiales bacterium]MCW5603067.1 PH domain-containing protein [Burkholderiales bacterium]